jgi:hypothetical protein
MRHDFISAAAADAEQIAGPAFYTGCRTHRDTKTLELWLAGAPAEVLSELEELHPGTYAIHNDAPRSQAFLSELVDAIGTELETLSADGIRIVGVGPTQDGYLNVRVMGDVPAGQASLDAMFGSGVARVEYGEPLHGLALNS